MGGGHCIHWGGGGRGSVLPAQAEVASSSSLGSPQLLVVYPGCQEPLQVPTAATPGRTTLPPAPRPAPSSPQPRGLLGFVVRWCRWAPAGGVVRSMCRQQPKVERVCRASPETCLAMPCLCACSNSGRAIRETAPRPDLAHVFLFLFQPSG